MTDITTRETPGTASGWFGRFGGRFVPETLITALDELVVVCPEGDSAEAAHLADCLGARWVTVAGPSDVPAAVADVLGS